MEEIDVDETMVKVNVNQDSYTLDGYLKSNLDYMKQNLKKDYDGLVIIDGRERYGKSTLASQIAYYLDPTYSLDRCCFTADQFIDAVKKAEKYQAIVFDEAFGSLNSRQALSRLNRALVKVLSEMGFKNLFIVMCIPSYFELDKYPAIHRSEGLLHVYQRSRMMFFDYKTKKKMYFKGKKTYSYCLSPSFICRFVKFMPYDKEAYNRKKQESIFTNTKINDRETRWLGQRDILVKWMHTNFNVTEQEISDIIDVDRVNINRILRE